MEEPRDLLAHAVVGRGGALAQVVDAPVDVGVLGGVEARDGVDDRAWLLAGGGVVEVNQRLAAYPLREDREVLPQLFDVERGVGRRWPSSPAQTPPRRSSSRRSSSSRTGASATSSDDLGGEGVGEQPLARPPPGCRGSGRRTGRRRRAGRPWRRGCTSRRRRRSRAAAWCRPARRRCRSRLRLVCLASVFCASGLHEHLAVEDARATGRRGCPCRPPSSGSWAGRGRWRVWLSTTGRRA